MNINDWNTIQTRKDVVTIKHMLQDRSKKYLPILFEVFLLLLSFALDQVYVAEQKPNWPWIIIVVAGIIVPAIAIIIDICQTQKRKFFSKRVPSVHELVSLFDDEISYAVMSSDDFYNYFAKISSISDHRDALLAEFYYTESSYYLNKAVSNLQKLDIMLPSVIDKTNCENRKISESRLLNLSNLILETYTKLDEHIGTLWTNESESPLAAQKKTNEINERILKKFLKRVASI